MDLSLFIVDSNREGMAVIWAQIFNQVSEAVFTVVCFVHEMVKGRHPFSQVALTCSASDAILKPV